MASRSVSEGAAKRIHGSLALKVPPLGVVERDLLESHRVAGSELRRGA
jgi:hypothetical protein